MASELQKKLCRQRERADAEQPPNGGDPVRLAQTVANASGTESELQQRFNKRLERMDTNAGCTAPVVPVRQEPAQQAQQAGGELQRALADARARALITQDAPAACVTSSSRANPASSGAGSRQVPRAATQPDEDNAGPPFFNRAYVAKVAERIGSTENFTKRFVSEVFGKFDSDGDGCLSAEDVYMLVKELHKVIRIASPARRVVADLRDSAASAEAEIGATDFTLLGWDGFKILFADLWKRAEFKLRTERFVQPAEGASTAQETEKGGPQMPSECVDLPVGTRVEVIAYKWCLPTFEEGAKKLRLKGFKLMEGRFPPRGTNVVIGSIRWTGEARKSVKPGDIVVAIRSEGEAGEIYLVDSRGLRIHDNDDDEAALQSHLRARHEAADIGDCDTVVRMIHKFKNGSYSMPRDGHDFFEGAREGKLTRKPANSDASIDGSRLMVRSDTFRPAKTGDWLTEPYWALATEPCSSDEGCLDLHVGQWIWVQFVGSGDELGWSFGTEETGVWSGWFPTDAARKATAADGLR